jgi:uncharacterized protein
MRLGEGHRARQRDSRDRLTGLRLAAAIFRAIPTPRSSLGDPAGGLWIIEADSSDEADALVKEDPFWPTGLRRSVRVLSWSQVFADGRRLI